MNYKTEHYELEISEVLITEPAFGRQVAKVEQGDAATIAEVSIDCESNTVDSWRELSRCIEKAIEIVTCGTESNERGKPAAESGSA